MFGWRARLGLLVPVDNAVIEPEFQSASIQGVSAHVVRLTTIERSAMPRNGIDLAPLFTELGVDVIGYACAETSFLEGVDTNIWLAEQIQNATGIPAVTASRAMVDALRAVGARRIGLVSPYPTRSGALLEAMLERHEFDVVGRAHHDLVTAAAGQREWAATNEQWPATAATWAAAVMREDLDAILVSATNLRTFPVIPDLERDLGVPVVTTNAALLWSMLHRIGVEEIPTTIGRLASSRPA